MVSPNPPNQYGEEGNYKAMTTPNEIPEEGQVTIPELTSQVEENEIDQKSDNKKEVSPNQLTNEMTEENQVTIFPGQVDGDNVDQKRDGKDEVSPNCDVSNSVTSETAVSVKLSATCYLRQ